MLHNNSRVSALDRLNVFQGGGKMGVLMRGYDWDSHPLGNPNHWPQSLKTSIQLLLNSEFPMFIWWSKELFAFHNDAYLPALGKKHPGALGTSAKIVWAEIWKEIGGIAEDILAGGKPFYAEGLKLYLERKGFPEETYWTFSYSPAFDDEGKVAGVFCACTEVTKTVLGQRRLKTLKDIADAMSQIVTLEQACQTACDLLAENSSDTRFSQIYLLNRTGTGASLLGKAGIEMPDTVTEISLSGAPTKSYWPFYEVYTSKQLLLLESLEDYHALKGNIAVDGKVAILPIFRPGNDVIIGFLVLRISSTLEYDTDYKNYHELLAGQIATSITSVQTREEATRQQAELINLFEQAPVAICILRGPEHVVELANPGMCGLWGKKQEDVIGKPALEGLPEIKDQGIKELLDHVLYTGTPYVNNELPVLLERNGVLERMYCSFVYHPMRDSQGSISGVIAVAIGINEQVEARQQIEQKNQELLAINADLDNFVYAASHDLKAPISNIEGLMETLVEYLPADTLQSETVQQVLTLIQASISRFKRAVSDLTEVAKTQREAGEDVTLLDLREVVADIQLDFDFMIQESQAYIETEFAPESVIQFSAKNVRSIVYNLLSNALKYRAPERTPHIKIATETTPEFVVFTIADNGLGIDTADKDKIFSMFKRLHDHVEGTGIGLYIVKRILENAEGKIEVESKKGLGTVFKVYFKR